MNIQLILDVVLSLIAVFLAIVLHEVAHGYVAFKLGDPTAKSRGRLTLNPLAHVDPIGTVLIPISLVLLRLLFNFAAPVFGWAKPVPINPAYFRRPLRGMLYVALAGPGSNLALAAITAVVGQLIFLAIPNGMLHRLDGFAGNLLWAVFYFLAVFILYNLVLAAFNLIPIPPLDGSRVLLYFLPAEGRRALASMERYGFFILLALLYFGVLTPVFAGIQGLWKLLIGREWYSLLFF
jgi:Zn-dependent protease